MELLTLWIWNHAWAIPAICDAVALACAVGTVALIKRPTVVQADLFQNEAERSCPDL